MLVSDTIGSYAKLTELAKPAGWNIASVPELGKIGK